MTTYTSITSPNDHQKHSNPEWENEGVLHAKGLIPDSFIENYIQERMRLIGNTDLWRPGWPDQHPHLRIPSIREIGTYRPLTQLIAELIGEEAGLHLTLSGFQSTERAWHQDRYLNPEEVGEKYVAAWIALDTISLDAGPFEFIPGSHLWPVIERKRVFEEMKKRGQTIHSKTWPSDSQDWVGRACEDEIAKRKGQKKPFLGKKGDVLLWHSSLLHRGSPATNRQIERRALIFHYSAITARSDMRKPLKLKNGSYIFPSLSFQIKSLFGL